MIKVTEKNNGNFKTARKLEDFSKVQINDVEELPRRELYLTLEDLLTVRSQTGFVEKLKERNIDAKKIAALLKYEKELEKLQNAFNHVNSTR